jgi:hypothetical protein
LIAANTGLPIGDVYAIAVFGNKIFTNVEYKGVYLSTTNGSSWTIANNGLPPNPFITSFILCGNVVFAGIALPGAGGGGVFSTTDNGNNWFKVNYGLPPNIGIKSLAFDGNFLFAGTDNGIYRAALPLP